MYARAVIACGLAGASFAAGWYVTGLRHESRAAQASEQTAIAVAEAASAARAEEARRYDALNAIATQTQAQLDRAQVDRRRADSAARSLRDAANAAASTACNPSTPAPSEAASAPAMVLANVLGRIDEAAGELAATLDASHAAGIGCQVSYDAVRAKE